MSLIIMACHDTDENLRTQFTLRTLQCLLTSVDWTKGHRLIVVDNGSCAATKQLLATQAPAFRKASGGLNEDTMFVITLPGNIGTAKAINKGLLTRRPGEYCVKIDNDVVIHSYDWLEQMHEAMSRMPQIGVLGLKRRDLAESPHSINTDQRSRYLEVPHEVGQRWHIVEECRHVMGTCTMLSPALLDRVGYFNQAGGLYGFDDSLMCVRSTVAGYYNCFLHGIDIDHIDPGGTPYAAWKQKHAGETLLKYAAEEAAYKNGVKDIYCDPA